MTKTKKLSPLMSDMLSLAGKMHKSGTMDTPTYEKITMRALDQEAVEEAAKPLTGEEIKAMREQAHLSQAAFARYLKMTPGYVSKLERGATRPTGPALVLLNVIRKLGFEAVF